MKHQLLRLAFSVYRLKWRVLRPITLGVRMMLVQDNRIMLVRHTYQDGWFLPGGKVDHNETPLEAAIREAQEETGAVVEDEPRLLGVYSAYAEGKSDHVMCYVSGAFRLDTPSDRWEIAERRQFDLDALPPDLSPGTGHRIEDYLAGDGPYSRYW